MSKSAAMAKIKKTFTETGAWDERGRRRGGQKQKKRRTVSIGLGKKYSAMPTTVQKEGLPAQSCTQKGRGASGPRKEGRNMTRNSKDSCNRAAKSPTEGLDKGGRMTTSN